MNKLAHCEKKCPGCGMTFSPDPDICPPHAFKGWRIDVEGVTEPQVKKHQIKMYGQVKS